MSAPDERDALTPRPSLYDHALRLYRAEPDGRLPEGGYPSPDRPSRQRRPLDRRNARRTAVDAITPFLVQRDGDHVVWRDWRRTQSGRRGQPELPAYRFDAPAYDAEIARAENDHSWAWPARITARLLAAGLRDRPDLMTRWDARFGWVGTDYHDPDTTVVSFTFWPGLAKGQRDVDGPWLQFFWSLPDDGTPPEARAAAALTRLETTDPKTFAQVKGGSREDAEALGFPWPEGRD
ncbi:hypothetical protein [Streptomyces sp. NPDC046182]|uniref:hypothetical protein n=1 Tax=Streptomyces sp. NPDC046182 TaxID=3154601 RepID=UPI0033DF4391